MEAIALIRDFQHRLRGLSDTSGYTFAYDALVLMGEYIPCREVGLDIIKPATENPEAVAPGCNPLWISSQSMAHAADIFMDIAMHIPHVKRIATETVERLTAGEPLEPHSFGEAARENPSLLHDFYTQIIGVSDMADMVGLLGRYQLLESPYTRSFHVMYISISREGGQVFDERDRQLLAVLFNLFLDHFRHKVSCTGDHGFLPYFTDAGLKPRDVATIKACFDLQTRNERVTRASVAALLRRSEDNIDDSVKRIKTAIFKDFERAGRDDYNQRYKAFGLPYFTDVFKTYAYFGFYPPERPLSANGRDYFTSGLSESLAKLR